MHSLWNEDAAAACPDDLALRVYSSRLLGREPALVLHGGGNTSVKVRERNLLGDEEEILYVKGSGWDLATIEAAGFTPIRLAHLRRLATLDRLSDSAMVNELKTHQTRASAPTGSVEAILHAVLPYRFVDHTHADALVTVTNTEGGAEKVREIFGERVVVIPYCMPGFELAREVARRFAAEAHAGTIGMVLMHHGLFSFGDDARSSYERMIELVTLAERYLDAQGAWTLSPPPAAAPPGPLRAAHAELRRALSKVAGRAMIVTGERSDEALAFCRDPDLGRCSQQGPATPDHVIRTKRLPQLGRDCDAYATAYRAYFEHNAARAQAPIEMLDPAPRVLLDPELGMLTAGGSAAEADIVADIYRHTRRIIRRAEALGGWRALPEGEIFDVEYWELEQAKLRRPGTPPPFQGEVALVTGAASGIGAATVEALRARGAAVVGLDIDPAIAAGPQHAERLGLVCDLRDPSALEAALEQTVERFGGLDMLVLNAGIFPGGRRIAELDDSTWREVMAINLDANLRLLRECHPLLKRAPNGGRVAVIGSKNVPAPGPGAAAYSASKAALNQLARVAVLEWAGDGIRINSLHPDAVFDTGLWSDEVIRARAAHYGLTVEAYKSKNLLQTEIRSRDVAELAAELLGPRFAKTTGAQIPIDGGNERVI